MGRRGVGQGADPNRRHGRGKHIFRSYLKLVLFALGLLLGVQVSGFIDGYVKRVDAHRLGVVQNIQGFQQAARQFFDGSLEKLARYYRNNSNPVFQCDDGNLDRLMRHTHVLDTGRQAMQEPWCACAWHTPRASNHELLMEIYASCNYQILFRPEVIAWDLDCTLLTT